jgi:hypothetical protein
MRANSDVLIALATYAQRWNLDEGLVVAERMRRDGMALRRAVVGIGLGMTCGYGKRRVTRGWLLLSKDASPTCPLLINPESLTKLET